MSQTTNPSTTNWYAGTAFGRLWQVMHDADPDYDWMTYARDNFRTVWLKHDAFPARFELGEKVQIELMEPQAIRALVECRVKEVVKSGNVSIVAFGSYVRQYFASLVDEIAAWLATFDKTMEDVGWWEIIISRASPDVYNVRVVLAFVDNDEKREQAFTVNSNSTRGEL